MRSNKRATMAIARQVALPLGKRINNQIDMIWELKKFHYPENKRKDINATRELGILCL